MYCYCTLVDMLTLAMLARALGLSGKWNNHKLIDHLSGYSALDLPLW